MKTVKTQGLASGRSTLAASDGHLRAVGQNNSYLFGIICGGYIEKIQQDLAAMRGSTPRQCYGHTQSQKRASSSNTHKTTSPRPTHLMMHAQPHISRWLGLLAASQGPDSTLEGE